MRPRGAWVNITCMFISGNSGVCGGTDVGAGAPVWRLKERNSPRFVDLGRSVVLATGGGVDFEFG